MADTPFSYWSWFFIGSGADPGWKRLILNRWSFLHLGIGVVLAMVIEQNIEDAAKSVLLPLAGIFIGLSFAWAGNAQALLQSEEIGHMATKHKGGFVDYVFTYQTAILAILVSLVAWGLAGLGIMASCSDNGHKWCVFFSKLFLFSLSSLCLRECWHVVLGAQWMLLAQKTIKDSVKDKQA
jgi:hypothetical protein